MTVVKKIVAVMIALMFSIAVFGCNNSSNVVAEVNGEKITKAELDRRVDQAFKNIENQGIKFNDAKQKEEMKKEIEKQLVEELINEVLIIQAAKNEKVYPDKEEINKKVDEIKSGFKDQKEFNEILKANDVTLKELEEQVAVALAYENLYNKVTASVKVTDEEMKQWYEKNKDYYVEQPKIGARAILIKFDASDNAETGQAKQGRSEEEAKRLAQDIINELKNGGDFSKIAKEKSEDEFTKNDGGLIKDADGNTTYVKGSVMPPEFDEAVSALKPGSFTTQPIKTVNGYYVAKLESFTPLKQLTYEEAKETIQKELPMMRKREKFNTYFNDLREKAEITNKFDNSSKQDDASKQDDTSKNTDK